MARYVTGEIAAGKPSLSVRRFPLYHMEKKRGQNGTVFCSLKNIFFGLAVALKFAA